ncbi:hypothetical protein [Kribbella sp. DT2]|uniref:hypothetical protein n=1 Tax=Kribbella sp. DT2 TaxID=3393427 RepID=UPI003CF62E22
MGDQIVDLALAARTGADVDRLEGALRAALPGVKERDLGDNPVNWSSVSSAGEPAALLMERITNMFDAYLLRAAHGRADRSWGSPGEAAKVLIDAPDGVDALTDEQRTVVADNLRVSLLNSDDPARRPTIAFRDRGIGLTGEEMPSTILSLHGSNKLDTPWLHGVFGKGGSSTSQYSDATIVVSRKQPSMLGEHEQDKISVAVVRLVDTPTRRLEYFRYLVDEYSRVYTALAIDYPGFEPGTYVAHVNFQGDRIGTQNWEYEESIYAYGETILFAPTLPYALQDARTGDANVRPVNRRGPSTVAGLGRRLARAAGRKSDDKTLAVTDWTTIQVPGVGSVRLRWWLFDGIDARRRRAAKGYVVLFTTNGQVHHNWDQAKLIQLVPDKQRVAKSILVQIDCDELDLKTRARIFDTFRTQTRHSTEARELERAVADELHNDPDLQEMEEKLVSQALKSAGKGVSSAFLKKLNKAISIKAAGIRETGRGPQEEPTTPPAPLENLYNEPTYFEGPEEVTVIPGGRASVFLRANAHDAFVPTRGQITPRASGPFDQCTYTLGDLRRGRMRVGLLVAPDTTPGTYSIDFDLAWFSDDGTSKVLNWTTKVEVVTEIPEKRRGTSAPKLEPDGSVAFIWGGRNNFDGSDKVAGKLEHMPGSALAQHDPAYAAYKSIQTVPTVVLNQDFKDWAGYRTRVVKAKSDDTAEVRKERYAVAVGSAVADIWGQEADFEKARRDSTEGTDLPEPMSVEQRNRAVTQAARTALVLLPDFDTFGTA